MPVTINGSGSITGLTAGGIADTDAVGSAALPTSSVLKVFNQTLTTGATYSVGDHQGSGNSTAWVDTVLDLTCNLSRSDSNLLILADVKFSTRNNANSNGFNTPYRIYDVTSSQIVLGQTDETHVNQQPLSSGPVGSAGPNSGDKYGSYSIPCMIFYNPPSNSTTRRFKIQFTGANNAGTVYLGRAVEDNNYLWDAKGPCSFTILEIAS
tara:strand:+ start:64 stop:690 length:627 start_codon:yes stop_codon:yes gene_type:complete